MDYTIPSWNASKMKGGDIFLCIIRQIQFLSLVAPLLG